MLTMILNSMEGPLQLLLARPAPAQPEAGLCRLDSLCWEPGGQGAETLIPNLAGLLAKNGLVPADITRIACVRGPGSFTGIRLALTTALGLSRSIPGGPLLAGIDYLPLLAETARQEHALPSSGLVWVLTHARRGQVHVQGFALGASLQPVAEAKGCLVEHAVEMVRQATPCPASAPVWLVGSGLARNRENLAAALPGARILETPLYPSLESLLTAACGAEYSLNPIEPLYLRASDAEENLPYIAAGLGLDPHQAMFDLLKLTGRS